MSTENHFEQAAKDLAEILPHSVEGLSAEELHLWLRGHADILLLPELARKLPTFTQMNDASFARVHAAALKMRANK